MSGGAASEWSKTTWGEEISLEYGKAIRGYQEQRGKFRVFGSNGPVGWTDNALADGPGVILGRKGAYRGVQFSREPFWVIDTAYFVVPKTELDMRWLYYAIQHYKLGEIDDGSPIPSTTRAAVYVRDLMVPPIEEQRAIAHILGTLDDKIDLNRKQNETLEAMARALFKAWFVDFEPVRAKMEGRWQRGQSLPGLPAHLYDLFPDRLVDSELGEIPEGWEHIPFGSLLKSTIGGDWGKDAPEDDHNQVVSIIRGTDFPDVSSGGIGKVPTRYTTAKKLASRQLQAGDIVLEISGGSPTQPTGRSIFISESILERFSNAVVCASFCRRFQPKSRELAACRTLRING